MSKVEPEVKEAELLLNKRNITDMSIKHKR